MRDLFVEDGTDTSRAQHLSPDAAQEIRDAMAGRHVCPFCGAVREQNDGVCSRCSMDNTSASRQATKARIGPWYVFQSRNPAAPGMKFETMLSFVHKGRVKARSVVRGPTTHQLWRFAAHVKGLSREFGICYSCGGSIDRAASLCQHCNRSQEPPADPDVFIEGQPSAAPPPVVERRPVGPTPLAADDIVVPPLTAAAHSGVARSADPLAPQAKRETVPESEDARMKRAEGFLSPQDLAAAFNLDFRPKGRHARAQQQQQQQQATAIARRPSPPKRPARWGRRIFLLLLLAGISGAAYALYTKPLLRAQAIEYSKQAADWGKQKWTELRQPAPKSTHSAAAPINVQPDPVPSQTEPSTASAPTILIVPPKQDKHDARTSTPTTKPSDPPADSKPDAWEKLYGKQPAQKEPQKSPPANTDFPAPPPAPVTKATPTGTIDDVRTLYRDAIDAEANNDFATAVKKYEQIKEFSPNLWPADLNLRLTQARRQGQ